MLPEEFIFYRFPQETEIYFGEIDKSIQNKEGVSNLVLQSFDKKTYINTPLIQTLQSREKILSLLDQVKLPEAIDSNIILGVGEYLDLCRQFILDIQKGKFHKVILSRIKEIGKLKDIKNYFVQLCNQMPNAFVYLLKLNGEVWIGATPELLLSVKYNMAETVALAGTKNIEDHRSWTAKEIDEHTIVKNYIIKQLANFDINVTQSNTITIGNIQHILTKVKFTLKNTNAVNRILDSLHPTPAICGLPKQEAFEYILSQEPHQRKLYTGYIGIQQKDRQDYFVNLRCGQFFKDKTYLYLGGGLTKDSQPQQEYEETELKSQSLGSVSFFQDV